MNEGVSIVLFDGSCNLCHEAVMFIIKRDRQGHFKFAPLQSSYARDFMKHAGIDETTDDTMLLVEQGIVHDRSTAALLIARHLDGLWPLFYGFIIIPRPLRDSIYRWVARHRAKWFGRTSACLRPTPELHDRFIQLS